MRHYPVPHQKYCATAILYDRVKYVGQCDFGFLSLINIPLRVTQTPKGDSGLGRVGCRLAECGMC